MPHPDRTADPFSKAMDWFEKADYKKAFALLKQEALKGNTESYATLALMYDCGFGVGKNPQQALHWYKKAWKYNGSSGICSNIASLYAETGNARQAEFWWNKAITRFQDGDAALDLAKFLIRRNGKRNQDKIRRLLNLAVEYDYTTEPAKREARKIIALCMKKTA